MIKLPKEIRVLQGSPEWHAYRATKIMASDISAIMGCGFKSAQDLYEEKVEGKTVQLNDAMRRGIRLEPEARRWAEVTLGIKYEPKVFQHGFHEWLGASYDGVEEMEWSAIEIKCGESAYRHALKGDIPDYYKYQMLAQMEILGLDFIHYIVYLEDRLPIVIRYERDDVMIEEMIMKCKRFYFDHIVPKIPPKPRTEKVVLSDMDSEKKTRLEVNLANREALKGKIKHLEELVECLEKLIIEDCDGKSLEIGKWKVTKTVHKGTVDWKSIPELKSIDTEKYRKPDVTYWRFT